MMYALHDIYRKIGLIHHDLLRDFAISLQFGAHRSIHRGVGTIFHRLRRFDPWRDSPKDIVWRRTRPDGTYFVKEYIKTKQFTLVTLADLSPSMRFCLSMPHKEMMLLEIMGVLGLTCVRDADKFGCIGFSNDVVYHEYPLAGQDNLYYILGKVYEYFQEPIPEAKPKLQSGTDLDRAMSFLLQQYEGDSLVVVITDCIGCEPILNSKLLARVRALHDVVVLILDDSEEFEGIGKGFGYVPVKDPETGTIVDIPRKNIEKIKDHLAQTRRRMQATLKSQGIDSAVLTYGTHIKELAKLFYKRRAT